MKLRFFSLFVLLGLVLTLGGTVQAASCPPDFLFGCVLRGFGPYGLIVENTRGSTNDKAIFGYASASSGPTMGLYGRSDSTNGRGVRGYVAATIGTTVGAEGQSASNGGRGVFGLASAANGYTYGVLGQSTSTNGRGVYGYASASSGETYGVYGVTISANGYGVRGHAATTSGTTAGVEGDTASPSGQGVLGYARATSGAGIGVRGRSDSTSGIGVYGHVFTTSGPTNGVLGISSSTSGIGVQGIASASSGTSYGVLGSAASPSGYAGYFRGNVRVVGNLSVTGAKNFVIDHPLDPANKYLYHAAVEGPEMLNIYSGNVTTDANGAATVSLPAYFEALNRDFRYQLTVVGRFAQAIVASEIKDNRFTIKTDQPNTKVSWQVTGVRNDAYAQAHPMQVEVEKPQADRGTYLAPKEHGQPESKGVDYDKQKDREALAAGMPFDHAVTAPDRDP